MVLQITILISLILLFSVAYAHPAGTVKAAFDAKTELLSVEYVHKVKDSADHYIKFVQIDVNGNVAIQHTLSLQESVSGGTLIYKLPALKKGDIISVLTKCNKGGDKSTSIKIP
jgi:hypothetical protein